MFNLTLFSVSVGFYNLIWFLITGKPDMGTGYLVTLVLLCAPFNIGGNIFTILGSARNKDGDVYSLFSLYQKGKDVGSVFGAFYQKAGNEAVVLFGLAGYQGAGNNVVVVIGLSGYQKAGEKAKALRIFYVKSRLILAQKPKYYTLRLFTFLLLF